MNTLGERGHLSFIHHYLSLVVEAGTKHEALRGEKITSGNEES